MGLINKVPILAVIGTIYGFQCSINGQYSATSADLTTGTLHIAARVAT